MDLGTYLATFPAAADGREESRENENTKKNKNKTQIEMPIHARTKYEHFLYNYGNVNFSHASCSTFPFIKGKENFKAIFLDFTIVRERNYCERKGDGLKFVYLRSWSKLASLSLSPSAPGMTTRNFPTHEWSEISVAGRALKCV